MTKRGFKDNARPVSQGDPGQTAILPEHEAAIRRYCMRRGVAVHDLDDVIQDVRLRLLRLDRAQTIENPQAYLFQITANLLRDRHRADRSRHRTDHVGIDDHELRDHSPGPERLNLDRETLEQLRAAILALPQRTRSVFLLHRFEDFTYSEIAQHLGLSTSAVEKHMMRALRRIARELER